MTLTVHLPAHPELQLQPPELLQMESVSLAPPALQVGEPLAPPVVQVEKVLKEVAS